MVAPAHRLYGGWGLGCTAVGACEELQDHITCRLHAASVRLPAVHRLAGRGALFNPAVAYGSSRELTLLG